jgi:hypothetical protein
MPPHLLHTNPPLSSPTLQSPFPNGFTFVLHSKQNPSLLAISASPDAIAIETTGVWFTGETRTDSSPTAKEDMGKNTLAKGTTTKNKSVQ